MAFILQNLFFPELFGRDFLVYTSLAQFVCFAPKRSIYNFQIDTGDLCIWQTAAAKFILRKTITELYKTRYYKCSV